MKKWTGYVSFALLFLVGLSLLLYPLSATAGTSGANDALIKNYTEQIMQAPKTTMPSGLTGRTAITRYCGQRRADAFTFITDEEDADYFSQLAFSDDGVMGYIRIPRISVNLPIYHGTSQKVLERGVGHLQGSALPVGGPDTHCVLSAHRGLPSAALFTDLDLLRAGDHFYIYVLDRVLAYEVDQVLEVDPDHTEDLDVLPGEDLVTLVTCTPYGVNTHRLLVPGPPGSLYGGCRTARKPECCQFRPHTIYIVGGFGTFDHAGVHSAHDLAQPPQTTRRKTVDEGQT